MRLLATKSHLLVYTMLFAALISAEIFPAAARVDQRSGICFERLITSARIARTLGKCTIYTGTVGFDRVLWGFFFPNGRRIYAWSGARNNRVMINDKEGYFYSPSGRSADTLQKGQSFCLGLKGDNRMTCGRMETESR